MKGGEQHGGIEGVGTGGDEELEGEPTKNVPGAEKSGAPGGGGELVGGPSEGGVWEPTAGGRTSGAGEGRGANDVDLPTTGEGGAESEPGHNAVASIGNYAIKDPESIGKRTIAQRFNIRPRGAFTNITAKLRFQG